MSDTKRPVAALATGTRPPPHRRTRDPAARRRGPVRAPAGVNNPVALPAVFLYRLARFGTPILPGWLSFSWMRRHNDI